MLTEYTTGDSISLALAHFSSIPEFTLPSSAAKIYLLGRCAETVEFRVFSFKCPVSHFESFVVLRKFKLNPSRSYLVFGAATDAHFADETIEQVCDEFIELIPEFFTHGTFTISNEVLTPQINKFLSQKFPKFNFDPYPTQMFYMTKNQEAEFMSSIETVINLPEEYRFDTVNLENDLSTIAETWLHTAPGERQYLRTKLSELPYSLIRHSPSGNAVAFEHIDAVGLLTHQFTLEEHRQKGLGAAVEMHMCRQLIALGLTPFKFVELFNVKVLQASEKTSYWTRRDNDNGTPSVTTYLGMFKKTSQN